MLIDGFFRGISLTGTVTREPFVSRPTYLNERGPSNQAYVNRLLHRSNSSEVLRAPGPETKPVLIGAPKDGYLGQSYTRTLLMSKSRM